MDLRRARQGAFDEGRPRDRGKEEESRVIASPCNKVCTMNEATGLCRGCYRTLDEIARWGTMTDEERAVVIADVSARRPQAVPERGTGST
jgi:hypothetical protein